jgi:hypothetical protein
MNVLNFTVEFIAPHFGMIVNVFVDETEDHDADSVISYAHQEILEAYGWDMLAVCYDVEVCEVS